MRVWDFVVKELRQMRRDPRLMMMILMMPILQLLLYGYAVTTDVRHLKTVFCDLDHSSQSRSVIESILASPEYFDDAGYVDDERQAQLALDRGAASIVMVIPRGFGRAIAKGQTASLQALLDGSDPNAGTIGSGYLAKIVAAQAAKILQTRATEAGLSDVAAAGVDARIQVWYNPTLESSYSLVPGVMCMIVSNLTIILSALAIVRERELGTIEQLLVTPMKAHELMLGKLIPYLLMGFADVVVILVLSDILFGIPMRGSVWLLVAIAGLFMLGSLGIGLLVSTTSKTQQQAQMLASLFIMPNMMLSGFMFPIANMPTWLQPITFLLPMRYFLASVRGIMMKGNGFGDLSGEVWPLALLSVSIFIAAILRFQKRLD